MGFRADVRDQLHALLVTFNTEQSSLQQVYAARPPDFTATPCAFVGGISEPRILHTAGVRQRDVEAQLILVDTISDNVETANVLDDLTDALIDKLTDNPGQIATNTVQAPTRVDVTELDVGGVPYAAVVITVTSQIQQGRL